MKFEIINPSDPYHMEAPDLVVAAVAACFLGDGKYGLKGLDEADQDMPIFIFGGADEWFIKKFGMNYQDTAEKLLEHRNEELAAAFDSVSLQRAERSSLNDIGGRAKAIAQAVRRKAQELQSEQQP
jgi:hypothetical protein